MKNFLIFIYIVCVFKTFYLTPFSLFSDLLLQILSLGGIYVLIVKKYYKIRFYRNIVIGLTLLIITSIFSAYTQLKQDLLSSFIATQQLIKGFSPFFIIYIIKNKDIDFNRIIKWIINFVWLYALFIAITSLTGWSYTFISPLSGNELLITANKYSKEILFFGVIYYLINYFIWAELKNLFFAFIILVSTQLYDIQRADIIFVSFLFLIMMYSFRNRNSLKKLILTVPFILVLVIFIISFMDFSEISEKFSQMFILLDSEKVGEISDPSIFIRIQEAEFAIRGFLESPMFGNGLMRASKQESLIGSIYFYPGDIGLIGVIYTFGLAGILIYLRYGYRLIKVKLKYLRPIGLVFFFTAIYLFIYSIKDGSMMFNPTQVIFYMLIYRYYEYKEGEKQSY